MRSAGGLMAINSFGMEAVACKAPAIAASIWSKQSLEYSFGARIRRSQNIMNGKVSA
jgi:hypothetical protein